MKGKIVFSGRTLRKAAATLAENTKQLNGNARKGQKKQK